MTAIAAGAPPRPAFGPMVVPLLALALFINYIDRGTLGTAAPLIKDELHLSGAQLGVLTSAFFWTYTPGQILAGWLSEKINAYRTLAIGLALWSLATFFTGFATGFAMILALRLLLGLGETAIFPCSSKMIAQNVPGAKLGAANGLISQGLSLGPAFGVFTGGMFMATFGWRGIFLGFGAVSIFWLVPWFLTTRHLSRAAADPATAGPPAPSFAAILRHRELWGGALGHFCINYGFYFVISWLPLYLVKERGYSVTQMAGVGGLIYLVYAASAYGSGWLTDRWIGAGATPTLARKTAQVGGCLLGAAGYLACALGSPQLAIAALFVTGVAFGAMAPHVYAIPQTLAGPRAAGKWVGVQNCCGNVAGIVGPIVTGELLDRTGGFSAALMVTAAIVVIGAIGWGVIIPRIEPVDWDRA
jgi:MFS family permease